MTEHDGIDMTIADRPSPDDVDALYQVLDAGESSPRRDPAVAKGWKTSFLWLSTWGRAYLMLPGERPAGAAVAAHWPAFARRVQFSRMRAAITCRWSDRRLAKVVWADIDVEQAEQAARTEQGREKVEAMAAEHGYVDPEIA